jgi:RinA family phage transcriptional activator
LRNYPYLKRELDEIRQDIIEAAATQDDLGVRIQSNGTTSVTERKGMALESNFRIRRLTQTCRDIERALAQMPTDRRALIEQKYFRRGVRDMVVADDLHLTERTYRRWKGWCVHFIGYHMGFVKEPPAFPE